MLEYEINNNINPTKFTW